MMTDVVAAPQSDVVLDAHEWLDRVVFEDEAVLAKLEPAPHARLAAEIARQPVPRGLRHRAFLGSYGVYLGVAHRDEQVVRAGREGGLRLRESDHRQAAKARFLQVTGVYREAGD